MGYCCSQCFGDRGLHETIQYRSTVRGDCDYCGSTDVELVLPRELADSFELLIGVYFSDTSGKPLVNWFRDDWGLFIDSGMDDGRAKELLSEILDDSEIVRRLFVPSIEPSLSRIRQWEDLRQELMHNNRFFPKTALDLETLSKALDSLKVNTNETGTKWFRARTRQGDALFTAAEMGAPPASKASPGRANPSGIPYLYLASKDITAIAEIRPHTGEEVVVAEFTVDQDLTLIDLRSPRKVVSPFPPFFDSEEEIASLRSELPLLEKLGEELTLPVLPQLAAIDYIPSQYLCEFIKQSGYGGVLYRSSVSDGHNLALFDPSKAVVGEIQSHTVTRVSVEVS